MLSKYTIALLGLATLAFVLVDRRSWRWLIRPEPYLAAGLAALIFSPVFPWNATHEWASFVFQGKDRWSGTPDFSLHLLVLSALLLLTPTGLVAIVANLFTGRVTLASSLAGSKSRDQTKLFAQIFTLVPLAIFVLHSLQGAPKLNWTGPVWLAALPLLGWSIAQCGERGQQGLPKFWHKLWRPTVVTLLLVYGGGLYWLFLGLPGLNSMAGEAFPVAWQETADIINQIQMKIQEEDGIQSIFSGLDKYFISSEFAFYGNHWNDLEMVSGRHLFGMNSMMFGYWAPSSNSDGKTIMVASFKKQDLDRSNLRKNFTEMSEISSEFIVKNAHLINTLYYRLGYYYSSIVLPLANPRFALKSIDPGMKQGRKPIALHGLVHGPVPKG
jgi:dolichol-phosphate mannosyltransferase